MAKLSAANSLQWQKILQKSF